MSAETTRVLVVESDPQSLDMLTTSLLASGNGFRISAANRLASAVECLRETTFDVVLLDLRLPDSTGLGTFARLYAEAPDTPIVVLAQSADETIALKAVQSGAQDYLIKDEVHGTLLARSLRYAVEHRQAQEQIRVQATLLGAVGEAVIATDPEGRIRFWNRFAEELYGWAPREVIGQSIVDVVVPEASRAEAETAFRQVLDGVVWSGDLTLQRRGGATFTAHVVTSPIMDGSGELIGVVGTSSDVTERYRAAEALRQSEQRLRLFLEQVPAILWSTDRDLHLTSLAGAGLRGTSWDPSHYIGRPIADLLATAGIGEAAVEANRRAVAGQPTGRRVRLGTHTFETHIEPMRGADGEVAGAIGIALDVTEQERMEEQLRRNEQRFRTLVENGSDLIAVLSPDLRLRYASPSVGTILGYTMDHLSALRAVDLLHPEDRDAALTALVRLRRNPRSWPTVELRLRHRDGTYRRIELKARNLLDDPSVAGIVLNARDVTERTVVQEALRESNEALRALITASPLAIIALDAGIRVTMWNPSAERMFGWSEAEVLGAILPILADVERDTNRSRLAATLAGSSYTGAEMICRRRDGTEIEVSLSAAPIRDANGRVRGIMAVLEDLSPRRQLEERLLHSQKMEAVGRLAGGVAHDFNNLLTAITGHTQIMLESVPEGRPERADLLEIDRAAARAASLTKQLLAFSRKQVLQPTVLELNALVVGIERMLRRLIGADIALATALDPAAGRIKADPGQIEQVIMNLVVNARDAMPNGGTVVIATSNVRVTEDDSPAHGGAAAGEYVQLAITDSGVGMDRDTLSHIFEPFFTTKEAGRGTGLGLPTVYGIVNQSGGHVSVYSEPGQGTVFKVLLPRVRTRTGPQPATPVEGSGLRGSETILLVEDEPAVRALTRRVLQRYGYEVLEAAGGEDALALAERQPGEIHLLVTDVVMPGMSGREVAQRIARTRPSTPVLYTSGYTPDAIMQHRVIAAGAPFLQKPFTPAALAAKVREVLDGAAGEDPAS